MNNGTVKKNWAHVCFQAIFRGWENETCWKSVVFATIFPRSLQKNGKDFEKRVTALKIIKTSKFFVETIFASLNFNDFYMKVEGTYSAILNLFELKKIAWHHPLTFFFFIFCQKMAAQKKDCFLLCYILWVIKDPSHLSG